MKKPAYQTLVEFWTASKFDISFGPTPPEKISKLEEKYGLKLPLDFRDYLLHACPIGRDQYDDELTTWWHLDQIKSLEEELQDSKHWRNDPDIRKDAGNYIVFVDYMIWAWAWAICCKPGENYGRILQLSETKEFVSNNFDDFVQSYVELYGENFFLKKIE